MCTYLPRFCQGSVQNRRLITDDDLVRIPRLIPTLDLEIGELIRPRDSIGVEGFWFWKTGRLGSRGSPGNLACRGDLGEPRKVGHLVANCC